MSVLWKASVSQWFLSDKRGVSAKVIKTGFHIWRLEF